MAILPLISWNCCTFHQPPCLMIQITIREWVKRVRRDLLHEILFTIVDIVFRKMFLFLRLGRWGRFLPFLSVWGVIIGAFQTQFSSTDCVHLKRTKVWSSCLSTGSVVLCYCMHPSSPTATNGIDSFDTIHRTSNPISTVADLMKSQLHQRTETSVAKPTRSQTIITAIECNDAFSHAVIRKDRRGPSRENLYGQSL